MRRRWILDKRRETERINLKDGYGGARPDAILRREQADVAPRGRRGRRWMRRRPPVLLARRRWPHRPHPMVRSSYARKTVACEHYLYLSSKLSDRHNIPILEVRVMLLFVVFSSSLKRPVGNRNDIIMVQRRRPSSLSRLSSTIPRTTTSRVDE